MRLLGWLHKKLKQTSVEPFKDPVTGNYSSCVWAESTLDDHPYQRDQGRVSGHGSSHLKQSYKGPEIKAEEVYLDYKDELSTIINSEPFHGFLSIGTLGTEPPTPTFPLPSEPKWDVTETDLKLINEELEKFLEAEAEEEQGYKESLGRSSYVSAITLSGMEMEGANADREKCVTCPLQGYLFGSPIDLPEMTTRKEKVTLGEMFYRSKNQNGSSAEKKETGKKKTGHHSSKHFLKGMLKKFSCSSGNQKLSPIEEPPNSASSGKKLKKIIKMFSRKVHPENLDGKDEVKKFQEEKVIGNPNKVGGYSPVFPNKETHIGELLRGFESMGTTHSCKVELPQYGLCGSMSGRDGEYWIKTDANYLVLEL